LVVILIDYRLQSKNVTNAIKSFRRVTNCLNTSRKLVTHYGCLKTTIRRQLKRREALMSENQRESRSEKPKADSVH